MPIPDDRTKAPIRKTGSKDVVLVLGMHRSGTSSVAGTLVKLGATPPKTIIEGDRFNPRGYWESKRLMALNDGILSSAGSTWDDWRSFNASWYASHSADEFEQMAVAELASEFGGCSLAVVKDPRMCRLMPFWLKVFIGAGQSLRIVIPVRSPLEVSRSLWIRNKIPVNKGFLLWLRHVLDAELASREQPRAIIDWTTFIADWRLVVTRIGEQIGVLWPRQSDKAAATAIDHFLAPDLRHNISDAAELAVHPNVNSWVQEGYRAMISLTTNPSSSSAQQILDDVRAEFDKASIIFGGLIMDFEESSTRLRAEMEAASREKDSLIAEHEKYQLQMQALVAERDTLQERLLAFTADRDKIASEAAGHAARAK